MNQTNPVKHTGMIGLGAMGLQFARHMQRKGFDVAGYDINADAVRRAENDGIRHSGSPAEIGKFAEVVVVMVATDEQVESVVEGSGLIDALAPGSVVCIASSVAPETCRRLAALAAAKNIGVLDTPVVLGKPPTMAPARSMSAARNAGFCAPARCCKPLAATSCISAMSARARSPR
jgi:3-hydroxyisobutyrate dehydrogenase-like beta-hydroxyacid dehydrogenase